MSKLKKLFAQFFRFSIVGVTSFLIDYGLLFLLTENTRLSYFVASAISFTIANIYNYILSMKFVFQGKEGMHRSVEMLIFAVLALIGLGLNQMIMWILVEQFFLHYMLAKIIATALVTTFNFISRKAFLD